MKFFAKSFDHLGSKLRIERIYLARCPRSEVNDQEGYDRDKKQGNGFLDDAATDE